MNVRMLDNANYRLGQDQDQCDQGKYDGENTHVIKCVRALVNDNVPMDVPIEFVMGIVVVLGTVVVLVSFGFARSAVTGFVCYKKFCRMDYYTRLSMRLTGHRSVVF